MKLQSPEIEEFNKELDSKNLLELRELSKTVSKEIKNPLTIILYKRLILEKSNKISNIITM